MYLQLSTESGSKKLNFQDLPAAQDILADALSIAFSQVFITPMDSIKYHKWQL